MNSLEPVYFFLRPHPVTSMGKHFMSMAALQPASNMNHRLIIVMGVSGSGKTTIASELAVALEANFLDADDYHPKKNIDKMSKGIALNDDDRWPWLNHFSSQLAKQKGITIGACSSLKKSYRDCITKAAEEPVVFVYLEGSKALIKKRMTSRTGHFMSNDLLDSQFNTLEKPTSDELSYSIDISPSPQAIIESIVLKLEHDQTTTITDV